MALAVGSIASALGFSTLQEKVFNIEGFTYGGWMTFITYLTYSTCGLAESAATRSFKRNAALRDYAGVSLLAMGGAYFTNWALNYLNYTTRIVFKSCRVIPVMAFRSLVVGQRYSALQYGAGLLLVAGITLFTAGDAGGGAPNFSGIGVGLIGLALVCDALTANLEERQFFRIRTPASHAEVMTYLSLFAAAESFVVLCVSGELGRAMVHSLKHRETVPYICAFSVLGYVTVCLILLLIKHFGATNAEVVKSMRKVCQVVLSFVVFPKPMSWKYLVGGALVAVALYTLQRTGKKPPAAAAGEGGGGAHGGRGGGHGKDKEREALLLARKDSDTVSPDQGGEGR
ncbi:hypothetical protein HXX76_007395 [Chlamydomonas incerta]|uniref:Uncharacterized protein n=1 Tax=Chlamydomonas incerta TaxID=51695 RepID=A0A835TC85_CHLIN|nr:hypothetical protein HXX76_007395 [Chlamydomonas incerta]|eukprot:KAG2435320.1 hypothetical protein HXX76_007395 [Chlamydomonas incerta]